MPFNLSLPAPFLVMILITPPMASEPKTALAAPLKTSIRSILSVCKNAKSKAPVGLEGSFISTPSINTKVWFELAPRIKTEVC